MASIVWEDYLKKSREQAELEIKNNKKINDLYKLREEAFNKEMKCYDTLRKMEGKAVNIILIPLCVLSVVIVTGITNLLTGLILAAAEFGLRYAYISSCKRQQDSSRREYEKYAAQKKQLEDAINKKYEDQYREKFNTDFKAAQKLEEERNARAAEIQAAEQKQYIKDQRIKFASSSCVASLAAWVESYFKKNIEAADRGNYYPTIEASVIFDIRPYYVTILDEFPIVRQDPILPFEPIESPDRCFDYSRIHMRKITLPDDRIALAQAVSKKVQLDIMNEYKSDPYCNKETERPMVHIEARNSAIRMNYIVKNPEFVG